MRAVDVWLIGDLEINDIGFLYKSETVQREHREVYIPPELVREVRSREKKLEESSGKLT